MAENGKYRLVTRSDFDGLICAVLLQKKNLIDDIKFVHPKDMQDGKIDITDRDITTNLPYVPGCFLAFDHHASEVIRTEGGQQENYINQPDALSAARVVYNYYGGKDAFSTISDEMMDAVDQADSAQYAREDILRPKRWAFLNFIMDPRTGLGRFREFTISNYDLMMQMIGNCQKYSIDEIMQLPDVKERVDLYHAHEGDFRHQLCSNSEVTGNIVVLDLKDDEVIHPGNRFMIYALYPEQNISIHVMWGYQKQNTVYAVGKSIVNRSSKTHIGELMLKYGGGGHANAGTCQVAHDVADKTLNELIAQINADG
jgi:nanoRNase/pAp phosphatase (c-di-AMP/oligoRNAs hydrolase)